MFIKPFKKILNKRKEYLEIKKRIEKRSMETIQRTGHIVKLKVLKQYSGAGYYQLEKNEIGIGVKEVQKLFRKEFGFYTVEDVAETIILHEIGHKEDKSLPKTNNEYRLFQEAVTKATHYPDIEKEKIYDMIDKMNAIQKTQELNAWENAYKYKRKEINEHTYESFKAYCLGTYEEGWGKKKEEFSKRHDWMKEHPYPMFFVRLGVFTFSNYGEI